MSTETIIKVGGITGGEDFIKPFDLGDYIGGGSSNIEGMIV